MTKLCRYTDCSREKYSGDGNYCSFHYRKVSVDRFLNNLYTNMKSRVDGRMHKYPELWAGKPIMPRDVFLSWAKNHPQLLEMYKRWVSCDFDQKLTPSINRLDSSKGYTLDNVEWVTNSQNSGLSSVVKKMKARKEIYNLLGVNNA